MDTDYLFASLFVIGMCIVLIWATKKLIEEFKKGKATVTQVFQVILVDYVYFALFFMDLIFPALPTTWWLISAAACMVLYIISERAGDWIGGIYRNFIKPYIGLYKIVAIICVAAIVIGSYALAYLTGKGVLHPGALLSALASALIATIGLFTGVFGYANGIWLLFIKDRYEQELKVVTIISFFLVWFLIGLCLGFIWHLTFIKCAAIGIVVLMYFMIPAWVGQYSGIRAGLLPSAIHIVSLLSVGALLMSLIAK